MTADEEEDWSTYSSAGYSEAYDPWADLVPVEEDEFVDDEFEFDEVDVIRPPPALEGFDYLVKTGTCDHCIARLSGQSYSCETASQIGGDLRKRSEERGAERDADADCCPYCEDLFADLPNLIEELEENLDGLEFKRIQIGTHFDKNHIIEEDSIRTMYGAQGSQGLKAAFNEAVSHALGKALNECEVVKERPEVMLLIDTLTLSASVEIRSLYLYGRYRKLERGIPQTRWPCRSCKGREGGCDECEGTGQQYRVSVQDLVGEPLRAAFEARETAFHGMGREDIDVRCLGHGRPFVIEMKAPRRRYADLEEMTELVNATAQGRVEIGPLRASKRSEVGRIKDTPADKSYTIRFQTSEKVDAKEAEEKLTSLAGITLEQQTPQRVAHRRADKIRKRKVVSISDVLVEDNEVQMAVRVESGTYVKELIHSDEGRTKPSAAELLGCDCEVIWLDVEDVHAD